MRIAHITTTFPPYYGGTGTVCYYNAMGAAERGHDVHVFTAQPQGLSQAEIACNRTSLASTQRLGMRVHRLSPLFQVGNAPCLPQLLSLRDFDVIHLHSPFPFGEELIFIQSWLRDMPYIITYHQDLILPGLLGALIKRYWLTLGKHLLSRAKYLMVTSLDYARASRVNVLMNVMGDRMVEMPNGIDVERFHPGLDARDLKQHYGLRPGDRIVLFVGALDRPHYFKGVEVLLRSLARIKDARVKLLVVGDGDLRPRYQALSGALGLESRVTFCGRVSDEALPFHYALCDLLVLPSTTMGEAFGIVLLEAMACGKPVIASNLPGVRSVVGADRDEGRLGVSSPPAYPISNGVLVDPGSVEDLHEKLCYLLDSPMLRRAMGQHGWAKVRERYAWSKIIPRLLQVYEEVAYDGTDENL
jgi:glycosyltransferase involved in cell wall biosynthesis